MKSAAGSRDKALIFEQGEVWLHASSHVSRFVMSLACADFLVLFEWPAIVKCSDNKVDKSTNSPRMMAVCVLHGIGMLEFVWPCLEDLDFVGSNRLWQWWWHWVT